MAPITADLVATVDELAGRSIDFVVNTHVHGDHVGSNASLADDGAVIFAHHNLRERLVEDPGPAGGPGGLPVVTFGDGVHFHLNNEEVHVFHVRKAHTDGDAAVHLMGSNVIVAGDLHFNYMFPFIDLDSGGTVNGFIAGMERLIKMADEDTVIIPGHGELASGLVGEGRMAEPEEIAGHLDRFFALQTDLAGRRLLITAGPTHEPIDPVRFVGNRSSGKMGIALAEDTLLINWVENFMIFLQGTGQLKEMQEKRH